MALTKRGLGRGLSALIPDQDMEFLSRVARGDASIPAQPVAVVERDSDSGKEAKRGKRPKGDNSSLPTEAASNEDAAVEDAAAPVPVQWISLDDIEANPFQPRRTFHEEEMRDLVASVREHGILQPILVRPLKTSATGAIHYQLVAGERRWRAAREAGITQVPAVVRDVEDQQALELALIENVQRHDISPLDAAIAYKRLSSEFKLSQEEIARRVGKSRPAVANTLRLLDLPEEARLALDDGTLSEGHGRAILLASGEGARRAVFRRIVRDKLTVRDAESIARSTSEAAPPSDDTNNTSSSSTSGNRTSAAAGGSPDFRTVERTLQKHLGARLFIRPRARGGSIVVEYADEADLQRLLELLKSGRA